jgi:hypothetical protein|tara:strand:- start:1031 stop:1912 length:882 start_codon:yes stop_codon:yes gene_type:complete
MFAMPALISLLATASLILFCRQASPESKVLATVNGNALTDVDVLTLWKQAKGRETKPDPALLKNVLENIIREELAYRQALELGFDADPTYQEELSRLQAQLNSFKRRTLASIFDKREIIDKATVTEEEALAYFTENEPRLRTEIKIWQILRREEGQIQQVLTDLKGGASFEGAALKLFPNLPEAAGRPWELGYLTWEQVPEAWLGTVDDMREGDTSGIIRGPNKRFWIIKLIERRSNPDLSYRESRSKIMDILRSEKVIRLRKRSNRDLRNRATITYSDLPAEDWVRPEPIPQ